MRIVKNVVGGFDRPVTSVDHQHLFRNGLLQTQGSHTADELNRFLFFFFCIHDPSLHCKREFHMREFDILIEALGDPDASLLNTTVVFHRSFDKVGFFAGALDLELILGLNCCQQDFLIAFDCEMIVRTQCH